jgi:hypothetical protein
MESFSLLFDLFYISIGSFSETFIRLTTYFYFFPLRENEKVIVFLTFKHIYKLDIWDLCIEDSLLDQSNFRMFNLILPKMPS